MSRVTSRAARHPVVAAVTLHEFEALDHTHAQVVEHLRKLERMVDRFDAEGLDAKTRELARSIMTFFDGSAHAHHEEEERVVFPPLLAGSDTQMIQHVQRLQQDHGWLEEDWRMLRPHLAAIAEGMGWNEPELLRQGCEVFGALYLEHIALEESLVYPAARARLALPSKGRVLN